MPYLSNVRKEAGLADKVAKAARLSGQDVRLIDGPMPDDGEDGYNREDLLNTHDCIVGYEINPDYSNFWRALKKLEN